MAGFVEVGVRPRVTGIVVGLDVVVAGLVCLVLVRVPSLVGFVLVRGVLVTGFVADNRVVDVRTWRRSSVFATTGSSRRGRVRRRTASATKPVRCSGACGV